MLFVLAIGVLTAILAFLTIHKFLDRPYVDAARAAKLAQAKHGSSGKGSAIDWPQWRGPNRDGVSSGPGPELLTTWPAEGPRVLWRKPVGIGYASMAVAQGRLYTIFQDGDHEAVVCWNAETGDEIWRYRYPSYFKDKTRLGGDGPRSTPCVDGEHVYAIGGAGAMHCLKTHPATAAGEVVWKKNLVDDFKAPPPKWGVCFSPLVLGDLVYINPGGPDDNSLAALDKRTGAVRWKTRDDAAGYSSPVAANLGGKPQIIFFTAPGLVAVTPDRGEFLWEYPWETHSDVNAATPIIAGDHVFISSGYRTGCAVISVEADTDGKLQPHRVYQNKNINNHFSTSVLYDDHIYGFDELELRCLALKDELKIVWSHASRADQGGFSKGTLLVVDGHLVILGEQGKLAVARATPAGYQQLAAHQLSEKRCWVVPVFANGRLYVRDMDTMWCLDLKKK